MSEYGEATIGFIDLAGFTALTETHGDVEAADLVERFVGLAEDALGSGDRLVKSIGDAVMLLSADPAAGVALIAGIVDRCYESELFPSPRQGVHHGSVVLRRGDVFGTTVNIAARVADRARADQVLATAEVARAAAAAGFAVTSLGSAALRNISDPIEVFDH